MSVNTCFNPCNTLNSSLSSCKWDFHYMHGFWTNRTLMKSNKKKQEKVLKAGTITYNSNDGQHLIFKGNVYILKFYTLLL